MTLEILTSDLLAPVRHGFFTRRGGASSGVFHGLNCGQGSSDQSEIVAINRSRVAANERDELGEFVGAERHIDVVVDLVVDATFVKQGDRPASFASIGVVVERQHRVIMACGYRCTVPIASRAPGRLNTSSSNGRNASIGSVS